MLIFIGLSNYNKYYLTKLRFLKHFATLYIQVKSEMKNFYIILGNIYLNNKYKCEMT